MSRLVALLALLVVTSGCAHRPTPVVPPAEPNTLPIYTPARRPVYVPPYFTR